MEVFCKVWGMYPVGEDEYDVARDCLSMCVSVVYYLVRDSFEFVGYVVRKGD